MDNTLYIVECKDLHRLGSGSPVSLEYTLDGTGVHHRISTHTLNRSVIHTKGKFTTANLPKKMFVFFISLN